MSKKKKAISFKIHYFIYFRFTLFPQVVRESVCVLCCLLQSLYVPTTGWLQLPAAFPSASSAVAVAGMIAEQARPSEPEAAKLGNVLQKIPTLYELRLVSAAERQQVPCWSHVEKLSWHSVMERKNGLVCHSAGKGNYLEKCEYEWL